MLSEWFRIKKDPDAPAVNWVAPKKYPYFTDAQSFAEAEDCVAYYKSGGRRFVECDFLFEPTFLIHDKLQALFAFLEPDLEFKGVQLYEQTDYKKFPTPLYWLPYLPLSDVISEQSEIIRGKASRLVLKSALPENRRVLHCKLPADDIWLLSLEAAECLLRRQPVGIVLEKIFSQE